MKPTFVKLWAKLPRSVSLAASSTISRLLERERLMLPLQSNSPIFKSELLLLAGHHETFSPFSIVFTKEQLKEEAVERGQPCMRTQK